MSKHNVVYAELPIHPVAKDVGLRVDGGRWLSVVW